MISYYFLNLTVLIRGAEGIGKSNDQTLDKIQELFNTPNFTKIGSAYTGLAALQLCSGNSSELVFAWGC